jgi:hypothetical protein
MRSRAATFAVALFFVALFTNSHMTGNAAAATLPLRYGVFLENLDMETNTSTIGPWMNTAECRGVKILVSHSTGTLAITMQLGVPDGGATTLISSVTMARLPGTDGTYFLAGGTEYPAPATRVRPQRSEQSDSHQQGLGLLQSVTLP